MKKLIASMAAASALAFAPAALAQAADETAEPAPAEFVDDMCATLAADPVEPVVCTDAQKEQAIALVTEILARPQPVDEYQQMRYVYDMIEGLRQIFAPDTPAIPLPPRDEMDVMGYELCAAIEEAFSEVCTLEQRDQLRDLAIRMKDMPRPTTPEEQAVRQRELFDELDRIFPNVARLRGQQQAPVAPMIRQRLQVA